MMEDNGRSPDGSGYSAAPEPCSTVSAADAVSIPNAVELLAKEYAALGLPTRALTGSAQWRAMNAAINALATMRCAAVHAAADTCIRIARSAAYGLEAGPVDPTGWPETPEGAARHQSFAIADQIQESIEHETLRALAQAIEAQRAETAKTGSVEDESAVLEENAPKPYSETD